jgi:hypothetical protein
VNVTWKILFGIAATGMLLLGGAAFILYPEVVRSPPAAAYRTPANDEEANLQDIDYLGQIVAVDRSFTPDSRAAFSTDMAALKTRAARLSPAQLEMEISRLMALADNGHSNVRGVSKGVSLNSLPIRIGRFEEGYFVVKARPELADLLGAQVTAIDGRTPEALAEGLRPFVGGPLSLQREYETYMLISPQALTAAGLANEADRATVTITLASGVTGTRDLAAEPYPANGPALTDTALEDLRRSHLPRRDLSPIPAAGDVGSWATMLDPLGTVPLYLSHPDTKYWSAPLAALDADYVQINSVSNANDGPSLAAFLDGVVQSAKREPLRNAIIDLRSNSGGDDSITTAFTSALPDALAPGGRIFILTSGNTFSAAIDTAARLKYFGGSRVVITGEPMGDREQFWGEGGGRLLPNSKLEIRYATALHDDEHGCGLAQVLTCYYLDYFIGVPAGKLSPEIAVVSRFADYASGKDTLLLAIAGRLSAATSSSD